MSISGSLRDVTVADVIQFIQLGRRDGSLLLDRDGAKASFSFDQGRLILARAPGVPALSELIAERGWLPEPVLNAVFAEQLAASEPIRIGQLLVRKGLLNFEQVRELLEEQVRRGLELVTRWDRGSFEFVAENHESPDGFRVELAKAVGYEPPALLLEAAQIFAQREAEARQGEAEASDAPDVAMRRELELDPLRGERPEVWLVTRDQAFADELARGLATRDIRLACIPPENLARRVGSVEPPGVLMFDLRNRELSFDESAQARRLARANVLVAAVAERSSNQAELFAAGMQAVLPPENDELTAFVEHSAASLRDPGRREGAAVRRLRRVYDDLREGLRSATVTLHLMQLIAESFERAVLFLVREDELVALGAFGFDLDGKPLAAATRGLRFRISSGVAIAQAVEQRRVVRLGVDAMDDGQALPASLGRLVKPPQGGEGVVFPVSGAEKVIAVVYADSSDSRGLGREIELLELASSQVGIALENELLRARMSRRTP